MKKRTLSLITLLLVTVIVLTACGGNSAQANEENKGNSTKTTEAVKQESSSSVRAETDSSDSSQEESKVVSSISEDHIGIWMSVGYDCPKDMDGEAVQEFTLYKDGTLEFNGKSFTLESVNPDQDYYYYDNNSIIVMFTERGVNIGVNNSVMADANYKKKPENAQTVELTLENWMEYFEVIVFYDLRLDSWKEVEYVDCCAYLAPKENIEILDVTDGRIAFDYIGEECAVLRYNTETEELTVEPMTGEEQNQYAEYVSFAMTQRNGENDFSEWHYWSYGKTDIVLVDAPEGWACGITTFASEKGDFSVDGNIVISPVTSSFDVDITRIMGTITYSEK